MSKKRKNRNKRKRMAQQQRRDVAFGNVKRNGNPKKFENSRKNGDFQKNAKIEKVEANEKSKKSEKMVSAVKAVEAREKDVANAAKMAGAKRPLGKIEKRPLNDRETIKKLMEIEEKAKKAEKAVEAERFEGVLAAARREGKVEGAEIVKSGDIRKKTAGEEEKIEKLAEIEKTPTEKAKKVEKLAEIDGEIEFESAKKPKNDQWSVEEIEKNVEESEKNDRRSVKSEIIEIEVEGTSGKRRKKGWIWWLVGILVILLLAGGVAWVVWNGNRDGDNVSVDGTTETEEPEKKSEEEPKEEEKPEEKPAEPPKEEEKPQEKPVEQPAEEPVKEAPVQKPVEELAPRPEMPADEPYVTPGSKLVALTFDDGPSTATTPRLLDILQQKQVHVTFFVLGDLARRSPGIVHREQAEGHEVGSHTMYHNQLTKLSFADVRGEAAEMDRIFTEILGQVSPFTRPPYGSYNATVGQALGQPMILWSVDPRDWADRNATTVCNRVLNSTVDGSIVLIHDIHATTVDAVPCIIDGLRARGFEFLTVSELATARNIPLVNGQAYFSF